MDRARQHSRIRRLMRSTRRWICDIGRQGDIRGFGLVEVLIMIIVVGILAAVAMQSMTGVLKDTRAVKTEREMETIASAIVGNPDVTNSGIRSDFGYVGDVGAFPPSLEALVDNPGGYATWNGPYLPAGFLQDSTGLMTDEWGKPYVYDGGIIITSTGGTGAIIRKIADATSDYLSNTFDGVIADGANSPPGPTLKDSVKITIVFPNGSGSTSLRSTNPDSAGTFTLSNLPVGRHPLTIVYEPNSDTLHRYVTVLPRHKGVSHFKFAASYFGSSTGHGRRCRLVIQAGKVPANLANFPVLLTELNLSLEMFDSDGQYPAADGGGDIWFSSDVSGNNRLSCEVTKFTTSSNPAFGKAEIWVKVPSVSATTNTSIWVWYNNPGQIQPAADAPFGSQSVWDSSYVMVQHMHQDPSGAAPQMLDATANDNDGTSHGSMTTGSQVQGQIGLCLQFDGSNDYISVPAAGTAVTGHNITMEAWMFLDRATGRANLMERGSNYALWEIRDGGFPYNVFYSGGWKLFNYGKNANWFRNDWHYVVCTYNGTQVISFIDGAEDHTYAYSTNLDPYSSNYDLGIGVNTGWFDSWYQGRIDELRLSKSTRSAQWIAAQYNNQKNPQTFVVPGSPETP